MATTKKETSNKSQETKKPVLAKKATLPKAASAKVAKKTEPAKKTAPKALETEVMESETVTARGAAALKRAQGGKKTVNLSVPVYSLVGKAAGELSLPKEIFGVKVNKALLSQALRVYTTNQMAHHGNTKTRGEMSYSTKKIYKQKGTGGARHGSKSAPIFVHSGGRAFGPKYRKTILELPKKMKTQALLSALSQKAKEERVLALDGLDKVVGKTKEMANLMKVISDKGKARSSLIITGDKNDLAVRAVRNLPKVDILPADLVNTLEVIRHQSLILTKEAVEKLQARLVKDAKEGAKVS
jgi:large subunit ribosomal protein L4